MLHALTEAASHSVFCGQHAVVYADELPIPSNREQLKFNQHSIRWDELMQSMKLQNRHQIEQSIRQTFRDICEPVWDLSGLYEAVHLLAKLYNDYCTFKGIYDAEPLQSCLPGDMYHIREIRESLIQAFHSVISRQKTQTLSAKLVQAIRFMNKHYMEDLRIEDVAAVVGISVSYLHQLFKRELNRTFLDFLTEIRIRQAQNILLNENATMFEVSERVGYRSPQHFSQIFKRMTGMSPHEFREGRLL